MSDNRVFRLERGYCNDCSLLVILDEVGDCSCGNNCLLEVATLYGEVVDERCMCRDCGCNHEYIALQDEQAERNARVQAARTFGELVLA